MRRSAWRRVVPAVALVAATGCAAPTDPSSGLRVYYTPMDDIPGQVDWPERPSVFGGATVVVRAAMVSPCGAVVSSATRSGATVVVRIESVNDTRSCPAAAFLQPFEAEVTGLPPGQYEIHLAITSVKAVSPSVITISAP
ncbi:MAG: hypothetical protein HY275_19570 [Gemmatimonadetes bacterium]|nr:hypothetical protein [Gemmatimonadota bacterium]